MAAGLGGSGVAWAAGGGGGGSSGGGGGEGLNWRSKTLVFPAGGGGNGTVCAWRSLEQGMDTAPAAAAAKKQPDGFSCNRSQTPADAAALSAAQKSIDDAIYRSSSPTPYTLHPTP